MTYNVGTIEWEWTKEHKNRELFYTMKLIELENLSIQTTTNYLEQYPEDAASGAKTEEKQISLIKNAYLKKILPNKQTTKPDYLVSELLEHLYQYPKEKRDFYQKQYNQQKQT